MNTAWHVKNKLSEAPTLEQKVKWQMEHARHCSCRNVDNELLEELKKRYMRTHQEFWIYFNVEDHKALALWAADCAEHVLPLFEDRYPNDSRPRDAVRTLREWVETGQFSMQIIRGASLAAHAAARDVKDEDVVARFAARAAGQAVATAHVPTHAFGAALYAYKAIATNFPTDIEDAIAKEKDWQFVRLPNNLRDWVIAGIKQKQ